MLKIEVYHDSHNIFYRSPFGAVTCGTIINLKVEIRSEIPLEHCALRIWGKGSIEKFLSMDLFEKKEAGNVYQQIFEINYQAPEKPGLEWYYFQLKVGEQVFYYGNNGANLGGEGCLQDSEPPGYQITVHLPQEIPSWFKQGIMYQIFVDRFYIGKSNSSSQEAIKNQGLLHLDWYDTPFYIKDEEGRITRWDFFGGNLVGIIEKLEYLEELGVTIIYLNPIFEAPSNHKYDTADYYKIDSMFGDEDVFKELVREAQKRGISIILDGVFSHTGADSIYFNKEGRYPSLGAFQSTDSPYFSWYVFTDYPEEYESWWGVDVLPNVNELEPSYREFIYGGENSVIRHWLKAGAKGWRLDVADELPDQFIKELKTALKETDEEAVLIGEVWEDASNKFSYGELRKYFHGEELDSTMNYPLRAIWLDFFLGEIGGDMVHKRIMSLYENYPRENFYAAMNLIGSHDRMRILTLLGEAPSKDKLTELEKENYKLDVEARKLAIKRLKLLSLLQMVFPGVPCVYYGDEAGLEGYSDPYNRGTYPWGREEQELLDWHKRVINLRKEYSVLVEGDFKSFCQGEDVYGVLRTNSSEQILTLVNRNPFEEREVELEEILKGDITSEEMNPIDLLNGKILERKNDSALKIPPLGARVIYFKVGEENLFQAEELPKASGVLLSITSLPSNWGVGDLGEEAYRFVDFLVEAGQRVWQILPLNPLDSSNSPYNSPSAFAGNDLLLDIEQLIQVGLLNESVVALRLEEKNIQENTVGASFELTGKIKEKLYREAFLNFKKQANSPGYQDYLNFRLDNNFWLDDYGLYQAFKKELSGSPWYSWDPSIAKRDPEILSLYKDIFFDEIAYCAFLQYLFFTQWQNLKEYANSKGILIMGDLPMYVALDSADTWAKGKLFSLDEEGLPQKVAGVPPDYFSKTGQLWGNPIYNWNEMEKDGYEWWIARIRHSLKMMDFLRLDHFRGFEAYWEVPRDARIASEGRWQKGPGKRFFEALFKELGRLPFIVEDLGLLTPEVENLKNLFNFPGMNVFQFSAEEILAATDPKGVYYTGTHDNDTLSSWCEALTSKLTLASLNDEDGIDNRKIIASLYQSEAPWVIVPLQDILGLGTEARMNTPGTTEGNWDWQFERQLLTGELTSWLRKLAQENGRI